MGLRAWPEKKRIYKKRAPRDKKALKEQKQKNKKQNKGPPRKQFKRISVFGRKLRKNKGAPDFGA